MEYNGIYDDDGNKIDPALIPKPGLCIICKHDREPFEEILCLLNRYDQRNRDNFKCHAFEKE